ncbi:MAG: HAMP domain-containing histidine kinase [Firmicutes bacterium]|nr:HAMP domain-containing histidine kinase [Bacillota bacterium]
MRRTFTSPTEARLLRRLQWRLALGFALAFVVFDIVVVGLTYEVLHYHFLSEAKTAIVQAWKDQSHLPRLAPDPDSELSRAPLTVHGDELPRVVTWRFNAAGTPVEGLNTVYGLPVAVSTILPDRALLRTMPNTHSTAWAVVKYQQYRIMVGSRPLWQGSRYLGAEQSIYSMGRLESVMAGLLAVDAELSVVVVLLVIVFAFWLSGRSLKPIRLALTRQRDFIQDVSHELRTPLTIVKSTLELALADKNRSGVDQAIRSTLQEVDYVTRLIGDLATLARIDSGTTLLEPEVFDIFQLADEVVTALQPLATERHIHLHLNHEGSERLVEADPVHIRQLLLILLDNALKYNRPHGEADVTILVDPKKVHLTVEDTGSGIPEDDLPHLFERFYRSRTTTRLAPGSGLGLAIADWIVRAHRGVIRVNSQVGRGTKFVVEWPSRSEG